MIRSRSRSRTAELDPGIYARIGSYVELRREFGRYGRSDSFSSEGLEALHEELEAVGEAVGEPVQLDVIGLCCDWTEYASEAEAEEAHGMDMDEIADRHRVLRLPGGGVVVSVF